MGVSHVWFFNFLHAAIMDNVSMCSCLSRGKDTRCFMVVGAQNKL